MTNLKISGRIASIDILRGIAIFGMILCANIGWQSDLPAWMFHAQVPPPDYVFNPDVKGITWVDLVFPFFLFSMGAAFPFAINKRLASGYPTYKIILGLVKRWVILTAFSIVLGNCYTAIGSGANRFLAYLFMLLSWGGLFLALTRFSFMSPRLALSANISGIVLIVLLGFVMKFITGAPMSKNHSDIIIMVLAYVSLFGGIVWIATRKSLAARWCVFLLIGIIKGITAYAPDVFSFMAIKDSIGISWIFNWSFLQYLMIAIAGSITGDMILKRTEENSSMQADTTDTFLAFMAILTVAFQLWGLFTRHVMTDLAVSFVSGSIFIILTFKKKSLWSDITAIGYILMVTGIIFDPIDGGITKDYCNLSYLLTTSGMAAITTGFLLFLETHLGMKARILSECGQNPMIAYTITNFITVPIISAIGLLQVIDKWAYHSPLMGMFRGLLITGIMMAITVFFTRKKIFWRS